MKRAVWLPNWIGDAVMATPALRVLREADPDGELVGIYRPPIDAVFGGSTLFTGLIADESGGKTSWNERVRFVKKLRREGIDEIVLLTNSLRTAAVARMAGIPQRVGFRRDGRTWLLTDSLPPHSRVEPNPVMDEYNRLASRVTGHQFADFERNRLDLRTMRDDELLWEDFAARNSLDPGHYVCFNSGGAFGAAKHWPIERYADLALRIVNEQELPVVMLCGPAERELAQKFTELADHPQIHSLAEESLSIGLSKVMVKYAGWMVTTDSGPRHFAHAFDVPVLSLYGPTHIAWSDTRFAKSVNCQLDLDCGPCQQRECPLKHHRCMQDLSVQHVYGAFLDLQKKVWSLPDIDTRAA